MQYLVFVLWLTGRAEVATNYGLFAVLFVMSCASLLLVPLLAWLAYRHKIVKCKLMNGALILAFICGFVFCIAYNKCFNEPNASKTTTLVFGSLALAFVLVYAVLKNCMRDVYYNLYRECKVGLRYCTSKTILDCRHCQ